MTDFFMDCRPGKRETRGKATFDLPILYFRDDAFLLFYTADYERARQLMPSDRLYPVMVSPKRTLLGVVAFNYIDTSIGPYGEVGIVLPVVYGKRPPLPVLPGLLEAKYPGFGMLVLHLPVTKETARDAGRGIWGYTKFVSDMRFRHTPEYLQCRLSEKDESILTLRVARRGMLLKDERPLVTYSVKQGDLIRTRIPQRGIYRMSLNPKGSFLELGNHRAANTIKQLGISKHPVQSRYFLERSGILPEGEVVESSVRPLEGLRGTDYQGTHTVVYGPGVS